MKRTLLGILILLFGEAFIIAAMLLLPHGLEQNVMILDIVVLSIIWVMFGWYLVRPAISDGDNAPEIGSLGILLKGQWTYTVLAVLFGVIAGIYGLAFIYQLLGQCGLFGILLFTWLFSHMAQSKVSQVAAKESQALDGRAQMKIAIKEVQDALFECADAPEDIRRMVSEMEGQLRYITPCSNPEAVAYEKKFVQLANEVVVQLPQVRLEEETIRTNVSRMQRTLAQRKTILN